jgi:predicted O-linked N-acetylglucosamine transferase (SPINDLY family)
MPAAQNQQAFFEVMQHHRAGRLPEAEAGYRRLLAENPDHADAVQMLGVVLAQRGRAAEGEALIRRAISLAPGEANFHSNLGFVLVNQGRKEEAAAAFRQAVSLRPDSPDARSNLGNVLRELGRTDEAVEIYRDALRIGPNSPMVLNNLSLAMLDLGNPQEAIELCQRAIALSSATPELHNNLASALCRVGRDDEALSSADRAIVLRANYPEAHFNRGNSLAALGRMGEAIEAYRRAIVLRPDYAEALHNLGNALRETRRLGEAIEWYQKALAAGFRGHELLSNMGTVLKDMGELDEALSCFRRSLAIRPDAMIESNLVYTLHFHPDSTPQSLATVHRAWNEHHARPLASHIGPRQNDRDPDRRLRVGYVSPDFRYHPVGLFLVPLLAHHDHRQFEIVCYSDVRRPDAVTQRLRSGADAWHETRQLKDEQLAEQIRADRVDVLVDLTMHMACSRLLAFARKPAPVQVTYLAYCSTTGLETMNYRLTDPYLDPPLPGSGQATRSDETVYVERTARLPRTYWCYEPWAGEIDPGPLPAATAGHITFGCLNNYCKVTGSTWRTWCELLRRVPNSRLLIHADEGPHRQRARELVQSTGVDADRIAFVGFLALVDYFRQYHKIDIALDPFPYTGGTTTCDALWMGVPVVSLAGKTAVSRGGLSILSNIGHPELVAHSPEEYVGIASELASDLPRLEKFRASLRQRMKGSPLMDAEQFARDVERAYRWMWGEYVANRG